MIGDRRLDEGIGLYREIARASPVIAAQSSIEILETDEACDKKRDQGKSPEESPAPTASRSCVEAAGDVVRLERFSTVIHSPLKS